MLKTTLRRRQTDILDICKSTLDVGEQPVGKMTGYHFTRSLTFQWKLLVMVKHGELFESKILVYVQPLITQLCKSHVHKHGFIVQNRLITINRRSAVHYDKSLKRGSLQHIITMNFAATMYHGDISFCFARYRCNLQQSLASVISQLEMAKIVPISH